MKTIKLLVFALFFISSFSITAQDNPFKVEVFGKGEPILLFPGFACTGDVWEATVAELSKDYECHVFTFAGFGDVPAIEKPWLPKIKDELVKYISSNKLDNAVLLGHSLGGALANFGRFLYGKMGEVLDWIRGKFYDFVDSLHR